MRYQKGMNTLNRMKFVTNLFWVILLIRSCQTVNRKGIDEVYQLAADMGGALYIFTGAHDADVMHNSATINLNVAGNACLKRWGKVFY